MKVTLYYEDNIDNEVHKTLRITLPKSWKTGPTSKLLGQFIESYNTNEILGTKNPLSINEMHLAIRKPTPTPTANGTTTTTTTSLTALASDAIIVDVIDDRQDIYVMHGKSETMNEIEIRMKKERDELDARKQSTVQCVRFGCTRRFPKNGPYPKNCVHHKSPPVFHETAKFWSCCPNKKAYDFDEFQSIPGCQTASCCTEKRDDDPNNNNNAPQKSFLGGMDLREQIMNGEGGGPTKLKSIDDFNNEQLAGGSSAGPTLQRLRNVLVNELGIDIELYNQVINGIRNEIITTGNTGNGNDTTTNNDEAEVVEKVKEKMAFLLKSKFKEIAAEQLRIK